MPRKLTDTIKAVLAKDAVETHDIVEITLPESGILSAVTLYCSSHSLTVDGHAYLPVLRAVSQIKFSLGSNADSAEVALENVSQTFGAELTDTDRTLDGASIIIKRAFLVTAPSTYETIELFRGVVQGIKVDQNVVTLTVVSDLSQRTARVSSRQITQRCIWTFNTSGSGVGPECGWRSGGTGNPVDQAGDPLFCDHILDSATGCLGHANQHRFGGVPLLVPKQIPVPDDPNGGYDPFDPPRRGVGGKIFDPDIHPWIRDV